MRHATLSQRYVRFIYSMCSTEGQHWLAVRDVVLWFASRPSSACLSVDGKQQSQARGTKNKLARKIHSRARKFIRCSLLSVCVLCLCFCCLWSAARILISARSVSHVAALSRKLTKPAAPLNYGQVLPTFVGVVGHQVGRPSVIMTRSN